MYVGERKTGREETLAQYGKYFLKDVDLGEPTSFFEHVHLGCTQRECQRNKDIVDKYRKTFESNVSAGATEKSLYSEMLAQTFLHGLMMLKVMQRNAWDDIANWREEQINRFAKVATPCLDDHHLKKKWDLLENCQKYAHKWS